MKYLWKDWPALQKKISASSYRLLILDFDGTLARIAKTPGEVVLEKRASQILVQLSRSDAYRMAIVSGRSLKGLKQFINAREIICIGNHGLELKGAGFALPLRAKKARKLEALIWLLGQKLEERFLGVPGVLIEDKGYTLSFHYRNVLRRRLQMIRREMRIFKKEHAQWPIIWKEGKKVWEARPAVQWGKGDMALHLSKKFKNALPIVIGDDVTDEDMFKALRSKAITIRVGFSRRSSAKFYLGSPKEVVDFLKELTRL